MLVARHHGIELTVERLKREHAVTEPEVTHEMLARMAREAGLDASARSLDFEQLKKASTAFPVIARLKSGFCVVLAGLRKGTDGGDEAQVLDPLSEQVELLSVPRARFEDRYAGTVLLARAGGAAGEAAADFGFAWFIGELKRHRQLLTQVLLIATFLNAIAFVPSFFSMIVLDKVVTFHTENTLHVLFVGVVIALVFNAFLGYLRSLLLLHVTGKLDIRAADFSFRRLLALPLGYFQSTSAGTLIKHMQQTGQIREFFTGSLLLTLMELTAFLMLFPVLALFSVELTLLVLVFSLLIGFNVWLTARSHRERLHKLYQVEGEKQSILTETINGMETVKTLALEPAQQRRWLDASARQVRMQYDVGRGSALTSEISGFLMKVMSAVVIWAGVLLLFNNKLSIGALIAFNMLAMRVTGPLVQLVQLVTKYQQAALSVAMLAGVLNRPPERTRAAGITQAIDGALEFDRVSFRYRGDGANVLDNITLTIAAGQHIGVVGRSGSGKTTLIRLLQAMFGPSGGVIRLDGRDLREYDTMHLRNQVAVVTQRPFLFKGTVRENIAKGQPTASLEEIIGAARLAGADEFIELLPQSYDTPLEEDAANLSGGQKQRLCLARALLQRPRVLILDEATSALDPESEAKIKDNFPLFADGRTVINVSHRLSLLTGMDAILVLDAGKIVDYAPHATLLERCELYRMLWQTQQGSAPHETALRAR